jgi:hypothetical protein
MDAFFAQVQEGFEKLGRDISVAVDKLGSDYNRANGALKRAETARKTGIVTERNARLSAFPEYVCELGEAAKVVDVSENAIASLPRALAGLTRVHRLCASHNALVALPQGLCPGWVSLKVLRLERNKLASLPPDLGELARLEELWLSDNQIESLPASVAKLKRLRTVRLARNRLRFGDNDKADEYDVDADDADDDDEEKKKNALCVFWARAPTRASSCWTATPASRASPLLSGRSRSSRRCRWTTRASPPSPQRFSRDAFL